MDDKATGQRIREIRVWRRLSLRECAQLSGISHGYLGKLERGDKPLENRRTREAIARTLRISPTDLGGGPFAPVDATSNAAHESLEAILLALTEWKPSEVPDDAPERPWTDVWADMTRLVDELRPTSDYAGQGQVIPGLVHDLLIYAGEPKHAEHRDQAHKGLISAYHAAGNLAARLGAKHLGAVASDRVQSAAELLGDPEWLGVAAWTRAHFMSEKSRTRQYSLAVTGAEMQTARPESRGMSHLTAALAAAAQGDTDTTTTHLAEADNMAVKLGAVNSTWGAGTMNFGRANVGIWKVDIGVELGAGAGIAEIARDVPWQAIPASRQGAYWMGVGRGLIQAKKTREQGLHALLKAEELTPQQVRNNPFVRDAITSMLTVARRDAGGRDLRGLAWRMGVGPIG